MKYFINKAVGKRTLRKPRISVCIPSGATEVEKKAVEDATYQAGAREVAIIEEPVAAAIGAGIDIGKACGNMIVDIGGGTAAVSYTHLDVYKRQRRGFCNSSRSVPGDRTGNR